MTGEMIVSMFVAYICNRNLLHCLYAKNLPNYTDCTTVINSAPSKAKNIGE